MAVGERFEPGYGPAGLAEPEGLPWVRLATAAFIVAITLSLGWRGHRAEAEPPQPPEPTPALVAALLVAPAAGLAPPVQVHDAAVVPAPVECLTATRPAEPADASPHERATAREKGPPARVARDKRGVNRAPAGRHQVVHAGLTRERAEVRDEYIAARDQVAALTGEDSGSVYLARVAARRSTTAPARAAGARERRAATRG